MRRFTKFLAALGVAVSVLAAGAGFAAASENNIVAGRSDHSLYKAGRTVNITGVINGDIFCAAQTVTIDATVNGDVICAGQTITINGTVNGNIRLVGQTLNVGAQTSRSVSLAGQDLTLSSNATVGTDVSLAGQTAHINGRTDRDITGAVNDMFVAGTVGRNVTARTNKLVLQSSANIRGNLSYISPTQLQRDGGAKVAGTIVFHKSVGAAHHHAAWQGVWLAWHLYWLAAILVFSMIIVALFPQLTQRWNKVARGQTWQAVLVGLIAMLVVPLVMVTLLLSIIGAPLALFLLLLWLLIVALSLPLAAYYTGSLLLKNEKRTPIIMLLGAVVLGLISMIPVLGWLVIIVAYALGIGTLLINLRRSYQKPKYRISN